jgi:hypothetical protein
LGIVESYKQKLEDAIQSRATLRGLSSDFPDKTYILMNLDNQIRDFERRLESLTSIGHSLQCDECKQWVLHEEGHTVKEIHGYLICVTCRGALTKVLMSQEAELKWKLPTGRIKQDCRRGTLDLYKDSGLIRKAGKYWLVHELVGKLYYEKKGKKNEKEAG